MGESYKKSDVLPQLWKTMLDANDSSACETIGAVRMLEDGRRFRYVQITGGAAVEGRIFMPAAVTAITSAATGGSSSESNVVTVSGASYTTNAYVGYYYQTATGGTGSTEPRKIVANTATTLTLEKPVATAASADSAEIIPPPGIVVANTASDLDLPVSGVAQNAITQNYYGWIQTRGFASVLATAAITEGLEISPGGATTAGQAVARGGADDVTIGICVAAAGANECFLGWLSIQD